MLLQRSQSIKVYLPRGFLRYWTGSRRRNHHSNPMPDFSSFILRPIVVLSRHGAPAPRLVRACLPGIFRVPSVGLGWPSLAAKSRRSLEMMLPVSLPRNVGITLSHTRSPGDSKLQRLSLVQQYSSSATLGCSYCSGTVVRRFDEEAGSRPQE